MNMQIVVMMVPCYWQTWYEEWMRLWFPLPQDLD